MKKRIVYRDRVFLDPWRCIDTERTVILSRTFTNGGVLYGYVDSFNVRCISLEDIISIDDC